MNNNFCPSDPTELNNAATEGNSNGGGLAATNETRPVEDRSNSSAPAVDNNAASINHNRRLVSSFRRGDSAWSDSQHSSTSTSKPGKKARFKSAALAALSISKKDSTVSNRSTGKPSTLPDGNDDPEELVDERRILRSMRDVGKHSAGIAAIEVWAISADQRHLVQPDGGWWRNPDFVPLVEEALEQIEDKQHPDYVGPQPQMPGVGLAGGLWAEGAGEHHHDNVLGGVPAMRDGVFGMVRRRSSVGAEDTPSDENTRNDNGCNKKRRGSLLRSHFKPTEDQTGGIGGMRASFQATGRRSSFAALKNPRASFSASRTSSTFGASFEKSFRSTRKLSIVGNSVDSHHESLRWRDLHSLTADPDHPTFQRLVLLTKAGLGKAAGVTFHIHGFNGIVIYFAKLETPHEMLTSAANDSYLRNAANLIGAAAALTRPRQTIVAFKDTTSAVDSGKKDVDHDNKLDTGGGVVRQVKVWGSKCQGGDLQPAPPMPSKESILTFIGAFSTLLVLSRMSESIKDATDGDYSIVLGPFGALMTLQYGLCMAPASQPRNALFGQSVAISIALVFAYVPESAIPLWVRVPLATATAIATLTRLGITHPPAGASALIISSGGFNWVFLPLMLLGNVFSIITSTAINNISAKRQYPTFWHFGLSPVITWVGGICEVFSEKAHEFKNSQSTALSADESSVELADTI